MYNVIEDCLVSRDFAVANSTYFKRKPLLRLVTCSATQLVKYEMSFFRTKILPVYGSSRACITLVA